MARVDENIQERDKEIRLGVRYSVLLETVSDIPFPSSPLFSLELFEESVSRGEGIIQHPFDDSSLPSSFSSSSPSSIVTLVLQDSGNEANYESLVQG